MPTELQAKFRQLAGATVPCSACGGVGRRKAATLIGTYPCIDCGGSPGVRDGTGRVYLFDDSVRVLCQNCHGENSVVDHYFCNGTGWVPSEDGWVWIEATAYFLYHKRTDKPSKTELAFDTQQALLQGDEETFFKRLLATVQTIEGVELG